MKKIFLFCALIVLQVVVKAQKVYFIYLQTENATPFYVRLGGQIQSSSTEGYLIIPSLKDSTYQISIGQPGKQGEPRFAVTINKTDRGFLIRTVDGNISLFDLQTLSVYKPISSETTFTKSVLRTDNFTRLLAMVADDSSLLMEPIVAVAKEQQSPPKETRADLAEVKEVVKPTTDVVTQSSVNNTATPEKLVEETKDRPNIIDSSEVKKEADQVSGFVSPIKDTTTVAIAQNASTIAEKETTANAAEPYKKSRVTKKSESSTSEGFGLVFLDDFNGAVDTIQLIIPNPSFVLPDTTQKQVAETKKFLDISAVQDSSVATKEPAENLKLKSQCAALATDDDFFKLRRDMTAKDNDEEMILQAKRYFKTKCYRTEQIKYLTALFLTEESKYQFFDAAYMHVSDQEKFTQLQAELKDTYYINRFKALIAN